MRAFIYIVSLLFMGSVSSQAADIGGITVNGEVAFDYNFLSTNGTDTVPFSSSAPEDTYRLNVAQLLMKKETEKVSFLARLAYVPVSYVTKSGSPDEKTTANIGTLDQVEISYKFLPNFMIGFGRFLTTMGYESLLKSENAFYGNSIAYQAIVPGYGEGLRARYVLGEWLTATVSTYNQANYNTFGDDYTPTKTTEVSATGMLGPVTWFGGYYFGKDGDAANRSEKSATSVWASYKIMDNLVVAATYDARTGNPDTGAVTWSDATSALVTYGLGINNFGVRYEMVRGAMHLAEGSTSVYGSADKVDSLTITDKIALDENFKVYVEYRADHADQKSFKDEDGNSTEYANMITLGAVAGF